MGKDMPAWKQAAREKFLRIYYNFRDETKKTDEKIADEIKISISTMKYTLSGKGFSTDFAIAFCRTYHAADLNYLFSGTGIDSSCVTFQLSRDCLPLEDEAFLGTFYGYCRNTQPEHGIEHFVLKLTREKGSPPRWWVPCDRMPSGTGTGICSCTPSPETNFSSPPCSFIPLPKPTGFC